MNKLTIDDLRAHGARHRVHHGLNHCIRCNASYFPHDTQHAKQCRMHTQHKNKEDVYPCCNKGGVGCTPCDHMPTYIIKDGAVTEQRVPYAHNADVHVGRWAQSSSPSSPSSSSSSIASSPLSSPPSPVPRVGDEIMVCGQLYHTGAPVVLWTDVAGYDHYRVERRFAPFDESDWADSQRENPDLTTPNRYGIRTDGLTPAQIEQIRGGGWDLPTLSPLINQFVLHYDEAGISQQCFEILQDQRDLSVHFMCDLDGTLYQALDVKERAWHATTSNTRSIGCEIANIGAYPPNSTPDPFSGWYAKTSSGDVDITIPTIYGNGGIRTPNFVGHPDRMEPIAGNIQGQDLVQMDYTPQQYDSLSKLIATLCSIFPNITLDFPKDSNGVLITHKLPDPQLAAYQGILGHYHIQTNKIDPGPAMQWDKVVFGAKKFMEQAKQIKQEQEAKNQQLVPFSSSSSSHSSVAASNASNASLRSAMATIRLLENRLLSQADRLAAQSSSTTSPSASLFYMIDAQWYTQWQCWLQAHEQDNVERPGPITNHRLLQADERTPLPQLLIQRDYRCLHEYVWNELHVIYGGGPTIVRPSGDIYSRRDANSANEPWLLIDEAAIQ